jgi:hypothetical protein
MKDGSSLLSKKAPAYFSRPSSVKTEVALTVAVSVAVQFEETEIIYLPEFHI